MWIFGMAYAYWPVVVIVYALGALITVYGARRWLFRGSEAASETALTAVFWPLAWPIIVFSYPLEFLYNKAIEQQELADNRKRKNY